MTNTPLNVLIVDDEAIIREGLSCIIDWESLGFHIAGFSSNGNDAMKKILNLSPDIVLMDIRMPGLSGIEVLEQVRARGFDKEIIILSGFSEFEYAKSAIGYDVLGYLTKPVDEEELLAFLEKAKVRREKKEKELNSKDKYYTRIREQLVREILKGEGEIDEAQCRDYGLFARAYQVVTYERFDPKDPERGYSFAELLSVSGLNSDSFVHVNVSGEDILLLMGEAAIHRFSDVLEKYTGEQAPQSNSPLDSLFIAYGQRVGTPDSVVYSYQEAAGCMQRRFFCDEGVHVLGVEEMPKEGGELLSRSRLAEYTSALTGYIQSFNRGGIAQTMTELKEEFMEAGDPIRDIKLFLVDLFLSVKERMNHLYPSEKLPFAENSIAIGYIVEQYYLYEILRYFTEQFESVMSTLGGFSGDSVMDAVASFIAHNYGANITLENIAPLFGYNSSYLGKMFSKRMGENFNSYLDKIRIEEAKRELLTEGVKVYTVAERVGYKNVDYFHVKFKKYTGVSPAEFRRMGGFSKKEENQ